MTDLGKQESIELLWVRTILYSVVLLLTTVLFIVSPKHIFSKDFPMVIACSLAVIENENLLLYDYKVYASEERYKKALDSDIRDVRDAFLQRGEILIVRTRGPEETLENRNTYFLMTSPNVPELNVEYYLIQHVKFNHMILPARTLVLTLEDIVNLANNIYFMLLILITCCILIPFSLKVTQNALRIKEQKHVKTKLHPEEI